MSQIISFSAVQPSGELTIGNYIGALRQWVEMQYDYCCIYCIADLHAMTNRHNLDCLYINSMDVLSLFLACGIDPNHSIIFVQSHVPEHCQLNWLLNCYTCFGEVRRMTQFKTRIRYNKRYNKSVNLGVFNYPVLMASDILLYQAQQVPVGEDQRQHLELCRNIAKRFNYIYNAPVFTIPNPLIPKYGSCILSLLDPGKKMSKSDENQSNVIRLLDDIGVVETKINGAVTDSDYPPLIIYDPVRKPGISNLLEILSVFSGKSILELESMFVGKLYIQLKKEVIKELTLFLKSLQDRYYTIRKNEKYLCTVLSEGSRKARLFAKNTLRKVYNTVGLINFDI